MQPSIILLFNIYLIFFQILLKDLNDKPVTTVNEKIQVCIKARTKYELALRLLHCWNYSTDFSAQIVFTLPPLSQPQNIQLILITVITE